MTFNALLFMIFCLCYLSCYNMVAKFYCQDYIFYAHVKSTLISTLNALHCFDQYFVGACDLKNYCFVITYLLEDEKKLSLVSWG
jgi:hypothetical protein